MRWVTFAVLGWIVGLYILLPSVRNTLDTPVAYGVQVISIMAVQVYRYRRVSSVVQRQQTKWVVFGVVAYASGIVALAVLPFGPLDAVADLITALAVPLFALFIPLSFGVAILRAVVGHRCAD
jgi:hypothetical protein